MQTDLNDKPKILTSYYLEEEGIKEMAKGANDLALAVGSTYGPSGNTVMVYGISDMKVPFGTKDGATVAKNMKGKTPLQNLGMQLVKEAALLMDAKCGDGTTLVTLVTNYLIQEGFKKMITGYNPHDFNREMQYAFERICNSVRSISKKATPEDLYNITYTSSNSDDELARLVSAAVKKVGVHGTVNIVESADNKSRIDTINGFVFNYGLKDKSFMNNPLAQAAEYEKAKVLVYDAKLTDSNEIKKFLDKYTRTIDLPLVIIAKDFSEDVSQIVKFVASNTKKGIALIQNPSRNEEYTIATEDICIYTGANPVPNIMYEDLDILGDGLNLVLKSGYSIFGENKERKSQIKAHCSVLEKIVKNESSTPFAKSEAKKRITLLSKGVVTLYVGGQSDLEARERKDRADDAYNACRSALEEGVVPGGGSMLLKFSNLIGGQVGEDIFYEALAIPFEKILSNTGATDETIKKIGKRLFDDFKSGNLYSGWDAKENEYVFTMIDKGIIDPTKSILKSLEYAKSVAGTILTTQCVIIN